MSRMVASPMQSQSSSAPSAFSNELARSMTAVSKAAAHRFFDREHQLIGGKRLLPRQTVRRAHARSQHYVHLANRLFARAALGPGARVTTFDAIDAGSSCVKSEQRRAHHDRQSLQDRATRCGAVFRPRAGCNRGRACGLAGILVSRYQTSANGPAGALCRVARQPLGRRWRPTATTGTPRRRATRRAPGQMPICEHERRRPLLYVARAAAIASVSVQCAPASISVASRSGGSERRSSSRSRS